MAARLFSTHNVCAGRGETRTCKRSVEQRQGQAPGLSLHVISCKSRIRTFTLVPQGRLEGALLQANVDKKQHLNMKKDIYQKNQYFLASVYISLLTVHC